MCNWTDKEIRRYIHPQYCRGVYKTVSGPIVLEIALTGSWSVVTLWSSEAVIEWAQILFVAERWPLAGETTVVLSCSRITFRRKMQFFMPPAGTAWCNFVCAVSGRSGTICVTSFLISVNFFFFFLTPDRMVPNSRHWNSEPINDLVDLTDTCIHEMFQFTFHNIRIQLYFTIMTW